jgi:hypothetical protein
MSPLPGVLRLEFTRCRDLEGVGDVIFVGDDWAEDHHDVDVCDVDGKWLAKRRFPEGVEGVAALHELVAGLADNAGEVVVGIETDRGLWVQAIVEAGYEVYAVNPLAASQPSACEPSKPHLHPRPAN